MKSNMMNDLTQTTNTCDVAVQDNKEWNKTFQKWDSQLDDDRSFVFPWKLLPNCRKFRIELGPWDKRFTKHGLDKRLKPEITIEPHTNKGINRYIMHQVKRLNDSVDNPIKF
jgi:hypothetical protein